MTRRVVLIHGAATDSRVWESTVSVLRDSAEIEVVVPDRPQSGSMDTEIAFLEPLCRNAFVIGVSGGATLGLELAARGCPLAGAVLHEPAAGSLKPGLLAHVAAALADSGVDGFGYALYGPAWTPEQCRVPLSTIEREFAMFSRFEPRPLTGDHTNITLTVGEKSPEGRYESVRALAEYLDVPWRALPGVCHAAHLEGGFSKEMLADAVAL